jgi:hypothetical protein
MLVASHALTQHIARDGLPIKAAKNISSVSSKDATLSSITHLQPGAKMKQTMYAYSSQLRHGAQVLQLTQVSVCGQCYTDMCCQHVKTADLKLSQQWL